MMAHLMVAQKANRCHILAAIQVPTEDSVGGISGVWHEGRRVFFMAMWQCCLLQGQLRLVSCWDCTLILCWIYLLRLWLFNRRVASLRSCIVAFQALPQDPLCWQQQPPGPAVSILLLPAMGGLLLSWLAWLSAAQWWLALGWRGGLQSMALWTRADGLE